MSLQHLIRALFAQYEAGGFFAPGVAVASPFGLGLQQLGEGAMPDIHAVGQIINSWSQSLSGAYGNTVASVVAGAITDVGKTAAQELGGIYVHTGAVGAQPNVLMPTAAALYAAYPGAVVGSSWQHTFINLNSGTDTITTNTGITITGTPTVATGVSRLFVGRFTAVPTNIVGLTYTGGVVTATTASPHGLAAAGSAIVANMSNNAFNGTVTVTSVPTAYTFTYALPTATAFATDATVPGPSSAKPALLNTAPTVAYQSLAASVTGWTA